LSLDFAKAFDSTVHTKLTAKFNQGLINESIRICLTRELLCILITEKKLKQKTVEKCLVHEGSTYRLETRKMQIRSNLTNSRARLSDDIHRDHAHCSQSTQDVDVNRLFHCLHLQRCISINNHYVNMLLSPMMVHIQTTVNVHNQLLYRLHNKIRKIQRFLRDTYPRHPVALWLIS